jgi:hypothetical protein
MAEALHELTFGLRPSRRSQSLPPPPGPVLFIPTQNLQTS